MNLSRFVILVLVLSISPMAFSQRSHHTQGHTQDEDLAFFWKQGRDSSCYEAKVVFDALSNVTIREFAELNFDITGYLDDQRVFVQLFHDYKEFSGYFCKYGKY